MGGLFDKADENGEGAGAITKFAQSGYGKALSGGLTGASGAMGQGQGGGGPEPLPQVVTPAPVQIPQVNPAIYGAPVPGMPEYRKFNAYGPHPSNAV